MLIVLAQRRPVHSSHPGKIPRVTSVSDLESVVGWALTDDETRTASSLTALTQSRSLPGDLEGRKY